MTTPSYQHRQVSQLTGAIAAPHNRPDENSHLRDDNTSQLGVDSGSLHLSCKRRDGNEGEEAEEKDEHEEQVRERVRKGRGEQDGEGEDVVKDGKEEWRP